MKNNKAFTLVELSIVLVIIGLLVSGVMGGQALIKQANIQQIGAQLSQYEQSMYAFKKQYNRLPGDIDGDKLWDCSDVFPSNSCKPPSTSLGNGLLDYDIKGPYVWVHLRKAGLMSGSLDISANDFYYKTSLGGVYFIDRYPVYTYDGYVNYITLAGGSPAYDGFISPKDAFAFDIKFDDGKAAYGKSLILRGHDLQNDNTSCVDKSYKTFTNNVNFLFSDNKNSCRIWWKIEP